MHTVLNGVKNDKILSNIDNGGQEKSVMAYVLDHCSSVKEAIGGAGSMRLVPVELRTEGGVVGVVAKGNKTEGVLTFS